MSSYATPTDLIKYGISAAALTGISSGDQQLALDAASAKADGYLGAQFTLPLTAPYSTDLIEAVCQMAAYQLLRTRGFDPDNPTDAAVKGGSRDAIDWLTQVAKGDVTPLLKGASDGGAIAEQIGPIVITPTRDSQGNPATGTPKPRGW